MATAMMASTAAVKRAWLSQPRPWPTPPNFIAHQQDRMSCSPPTTSAAVQLRTRHSPSPAMEVRCLEQGNSVKVRATDSGPHLVSLGSGRLSTNITIIPLPEGIIKKFFPYKGNKGGIHFFMTAITAGISLSPYSFISRVTQETNGHI